MRYNINCRWECANRGGCQNSKEKRGIGESLRLRVEERKREREIENERQREGGRGRGKNNEQKERQCPHDLECKGQSNRIQKDTIPKVLVVVIEKHQGSPS